MFRPIFMLIFIIKIQGRDTEGRGKIIFFLFSFFLLLLWLPRFQSKHQKCCITYEGDGEGYDGVHEDSKLQLKKIFLKYISLLSIFDKPVYICWLSATQGFYLHQKVILNKVLN